jgi:autotransporter-associated beta strand protein
MVEALMVEAAMVEPLTVKAVTVGGPFKITEIMCGEGGFAAGVGESTNEGHIMNARSRIACISAAVAALMFGAGVSQGRDLTWDANGTADPLGADGSGNWDLTSPNWVNGDLTTGTNVAWLNAAGDNAVFGNGTNVFDGNATPNNIDLGAAITVNDILLGIGTNGGVYNLSDFGGGSLTLTGNINKTAGNGALSFLLQSNAMTLGAGDHVVALKDTPGDTAELAINGAITGAGGITMDNSTQGYESWGTLAFNVDNSYTGATNISFGRLVITTANGLGASSAGTTISGAGSLSIGGAGTTVTGDINLTEPITIKRSDYSSTPDFQHYGDAFVAANSGTPRTITVSGPLTIDSTDARIAANTNTLVLPNPFIAGTTVAPGTAMADLEGDFAGFINLNADNTAYAAAGNANGILGGALVTGASAAAIGGAGSKLVLNGGTLHITSALVASNPAIATNFGGHTIDTSNVGTGVDIDPGLTFTVNGLSGGGVGERGTGTLNFVGTNNFTGNPYFDNGTINFVAGSTTAVNSLGLRSPVVNIDGTLNITNGDNVFGASANGTNGGPDMATVNISSTGSFSSGGIVFLGKDNGTVGTINQTGGSLTITRNGNFGFVLADGRGGKNPTGNYNFSGGTFTSAGEVYVGEGGDAAGAHGTGHWTQTDGTANINNWFVVGREHAVGTVDISGGTLNHAGGNMSLGDSSNSDNATNLINIHGTAVINNNTGEMWVGQAGGTIAVMNVADSASITNNNWVAVGRAGGTGTINLSGGSFTQQTANHLTIGSGGTGTVNVTGGTLTGLDTFLGEVGSGSGTLNISGTGNVVLNGTTVFADHDTVTGNLNLNGGTLTASSFQANNEGGTGKGTFTFNGGTLIAAGDQTNFIGAKVTSVVSTGGALINSNAHAVTVNSALTHDTTLAGADGGLTKSGEGILTLAGANTYTGPTSASAGSAIFGKSLTTSSSVTASGTGTVGLAAGAGNNLVIMTPSVSVSDSGKIDLADNKLIVTTANQTGTWNGSDHYTGISGLVQTARGAGAWNGPSGITSSTAAANPNPKLYSIGVVKVGDIKTVGDDATATFAGQTVHGSDTVAMYTYGGDANLDGKINIDDYGLIDSHVGQSGSVFGWHNGDFNYDGKINIDDYGIIDGNIGAQGAPLPTASQSLATLADSGVVNLGGVSAVPEPASLGLLAIAGAGLLRRRRRH